MERREEKASEQAGVMGVESGVSPMAWGKFAPNTGLMFSGQFMKRVLAGSFLACGWRVLLAELRRLPIPQVETDRAEKDASVMYDDSDEGRMEAAVQLAEESPRAAAEAFSAIACDQGVADEVRLSAAEQLADLDPRAAAPACTAIACDQGVADEVRLSAAELLATLDSRAAAPACVAITTDGTVADEIRLSAAELLATVHPRD